MINQNPDGNRLNNFRYLTFPVIPMVYDDALSYYEVLNKVVVKLNEVIDWAKEYQDSLMQYIDEKIASEMASVNQSLADLENRVNQQLEQQQEEFEQLQNNINATIEEQTEWVNAQIAALTATVNLQLSMVDNKIQLAKSWCMDYTDNQIALKLKQLDIPDSLVVRCPTNGVMMPIQQCLNVMTDDLRIGALTCLEYDSMMITCEEYDNLHLTCYDYDYFARFALIPWWHQHKVFSGVTGQYTSVQQGIYELWQFDRSNGLTAAEYDSLELEAENYDAKAISAYDYDWKGIPASKGGD